MVTREKDILEGYQAGQESMRPLIEQMREALLGTKFCCEMLIKQGGACGVELSEVELPTLTRAIAKADKFLGRK